MDSITTRGSLMVMGLLSLVGCARPHISPLAPPPYRAEVAAAYDRTWTALVRALAKQNLPLRAIARDSGVIASDDVVTPIGLYADCGPSMRTRRRAWAGACRTFPCDAPACACWS